MLQSLRWCCIHSATSYEDPEIRRVDKTMQSVASSSSTATKSNNAMLSCYMKELNLAAQKKPRKDPITTPKRGGGEAVQLRSGISTDSNTDSGSTWGTARTNSMGAESEAPFSIAARDNLPARLSLCLGGGGVTKNPKPAPSSGLRNRDARMTVIRKWEPCCSKPRLIPSSGTHTDPLLSHSGIWAVRRRPHRLVGHVRGECVQVGWRPN